MRSPKGAKILPNRRAGAQMSELTIANYLGLLLDDPYDAELIDGLRKLLQDAKPADEGQESLRLLEAARQLRHQRGLHREAAASPPKRRPRRRCHPNGRHPRRR